jgi:hypothetical protein
MSGMALNRREAAEFVGLNELEFAKEIGAGTFPPGAPVSDGKRIWAPEALLHCLKQLPFAGDKKQAAWRREANPCVYLIGMEITPYVKVGWAKRVEARRMELQTANPERLIVLASFPATLRDESRLHSALKAHRSYGEWFRKGPWLDEVLAGVSLGEDVNGLLRRLEAASQ